MTLLFRLVFFVLFSLFATSSFALGPITQFSYSNNGPWHDSLASACQEATSYLPKIYNYSYKNSEGSKCFYQGKLANSDYFTELSMVSRVSCPGNSSANGQSCSCNAGFKEEAGLCVPAQSADEQCRTAAMLYNSWENDNREGRVPGKLPIGEAVNVCVPSAEGSGGPPGCKHTFTGDMSFSMDGKTWQTDGTSWAITEGAGLACVPGLDGDGSTNLPKPMEPDPPCKGQQGTVNGKDVCIDASSGETYGSDKKTNTDANGNTSTTTTEVLCKGEQCTVTTTNTPSSNNPGGGGGGGGSTTTTDMSRDQFCRQNPGSAVCRGTTDESGETRGQKPDGGGKGNGNGNGNGNGDGDDDVTAPGTPGGELPKLWEKKYPNGVKGVWNARSSELKSSSLGGLATQLFPNVGDGGTPPSWTLDLDFGGVFNFGSFHLDLDSRVWLALKAFTIICALVLARRLVFGG